MSMRGFLSTFGRANSFIGTSLRLRPRKGGGDVDQRAYVTERLEPRRLLSTINWIGPSNGEFDDPTNWDSGTIPGTADNVIINVSPGTVINHSTGNDLVASIQSNGLFNLSGGTLAVTGTLDLSNTFTMAGGTLQSATVTGNLNELVTSGASSGTFDAVQLNTDITVADGTSLVVQNGLTLQGGNIFLKGDTAQTQLIFTNANSQVLGGSGQIVLSGATPGFDVVSVDDSLGNLIVSPQVLIHGAGGVINSVGGSGSLIVQGTIVSDAGGPIALTGANWDNEGSIGATNFGTLDVKASLGNNGQIVATNGTINLSGIINTTANVQGNAGTINLLGILDGQGSVQTFDSNTGSWNLFGTVTNSTLVFNGGTLIPAGNTATLDGVTLNSSLLIPNGRTLIVQNGLNLNGVSLDIASDGAVTSLVFENPDNQTITGSGGIVFFGTVPDQDVMSVDLTTGSLTYSSSLFITGPAGTISTTGTNGSFFLQGSVIANSFGSSIIIKGPNIVTDGPMEAFPGTITFVGDYTAVATSSLVILIDANGAGQFNVTGNANLNGLLGIQLNNFIPPQGAQYSVVTYKSSTGNFQSIQGLANNVAMFAPALTPNALVLTTTSSAGPVQPGGLPDLTLTGLTYRAGDYHSGDPLNISFTENNTGTSSLGFEVQFALSSDPFFGNTDDIPLGNLQEPGFEGAGSRPATFGVQLPAPIASGNYFLLAKIIPTATNPELNSTNNLAVSATANIVIPNQPTDLTLINVVYPGGIYHPGDTVNLSGTIINSGPGDAAPFDLQINLSQDTTFGNRDDIPLQTLPMSAIIGQRIDSGSTQFVIPASTPPGNYHLVAKVDSGNTVVETDETNNVFVSALPDIVLPAPLTPPVPKPAKPGAPDPNFGTAGVAAHNVGISITSDVAVQADGKSVIAGTSGTAGAGDFALTRYTSNGGLDTTFGDQGKVTTDFGGDDQAAAVHILANGQILVVGTSGRIVNGQPAGSEFAMALYNTDGTLDTTFGNGTGKVLTSFSTGAANLSTDIAHTVAVDDAGIIYVAGSSNAAGRGQDFAVAAFMPDGAPLTTFGTGGQVLVDFTGGDDSVNSIAFERNRDLVLGGAAGNPANGTFSIALARMNPNGTLDTTFGKIGRVTRSVGGQDDEASSVAIQPDGKILAGGFTATGSASDGTLSSNFAILRFTSAGLLAKAFGNGGRVVTSFGQPAAITKIVVTPEGKIIASGKTASSLDAVVPNTLNLALAQYTTNGSLDKTFGGTGTTVLDLSGSAGVGSPAELSVGASNDLKTKFNQLTQTAQGALALNQGGQLLDVATNGSDTIETAIVSSGVDLSAKVTSSVPATVIGGAAGTATIQITNGGPAAASGNVTISLSASANTSPATGASAIRSQAQTIRLQPNQSQSIKVAFTFPTGLSDGSYNLVANVDPGTLADLNLTNNIATGASGVHITQPAVDLAASGLSVPSPLTRGAKTTVSVTVTNVGNVAAQGSVPVQILASTDGTLAKGTLLATIPNVAVSLKAGASKSFKATLTLPATATTGSFFLLALVDPANTLAEPSLTNNLAVSAAPVVIR